MTKTAARNELERITNEAARCGWKLSQEKASELKNAVDAVGFAFASKKNGSDIASEAHKLFERIERSVA